MFPFPPLAPPYFNPLPPHGGRRAFLIVRRRQQLFQSTPSAWRETRKCSVRFSIENISIHSLRMEGDHRFPVCMMLFTAFQSTPSAWRETHRLLKSMVNRFAISIHSLRMEGDKLFQRYVSRSFGFQSTPSAWRETFSRSSFTFSGDISIHSLRMEGDKPLVHI